MRKVLMAFGCAVACLGQGPPATRPLYSASVRLEDWALFRSAASAVLGWKVGVQANAYRQLTFSDAAAKVEVVDGPPTKVK